MSPQPGRTLSPDVPDVSNVPDATDVLDGPQERLPQSGARPSPLTTAREVDELVRPALRRAVAELPAVVRQVAEYHFGWSDDRGPTGGGKSLRSGLVLAAARAVGGQARQAVPGAVAVELVHDFSLLHDDVIDGDRLRRHRPAAWVRFGTGAAVLAGDALWTLALQILVRAGDPAALDTLIRTMADLMRGQSEDVAFESRDDVTAEEYLSMAEGKTGALLGGACAIGALLGGSSPDQAAQLELFGRHLGVAFQCADDVLGIWGHPERTGKPVGSDVTARKKTFPVLAALTDRGSAGRRLAEMYRSPDRPGERECAVMTGLIEQAGGRAAVEAEAERQVAMALACLDRVELTPAGREELDLFASRVVRRDH
ncbi:geranylgeranyl diphosphate synthase type I [Streptosporangium becharense]|uniref:Geranylgeranyl diphosphate synthase type I n=1 Tax=Streptosporangium becharense TaxID=1816182 RepID=A0A7W9IBW2_9ACTN|nr:polyprenyl synthetase family protein [Streptosporangium becharense]MBB2913809.1 geranylgeranyl diphosphate synthase type I [Streptosporangium becharense]MBB5817890.1 geranylgeranyl diphosphate synthase type I [Streptosporangium becharense]